MIGVHSWVAVGQANLGSRRAIVWAETESDTKWTSRVVHQAGSREGQLGLVSVLVSVFGSKRVELRENRDFGDSLKKR